MPHHAGKQQFHDEVFPAELEEIRRRRETVEVPTDGLDKGSPAVGRGLIGLCHSGGGVRASTFAFGVLQALARHNLLRRIDYLSTVSGGGFIGACISAVLSKPEASTDGDEFPLAFKPGVDEPLATSYLRDSGSYLAPGGGLDDVRIPAVILRGALINLVTLIPYIIIAVFLTELVYEVGSLYGVPYGVVPLIGLAAFFALTLIFPLVSRVLGPSFGWHGRNFYERATALALALTLLVVALAPLISMVNWAIHTEPTGNSFLARTLQALQASSVDIIQTTWRQWGLIVVLGVIVLLVLASAIGSSRAWVAKIAVYILGLAGPAVLWVIYLTLCILQIDPNDLQLIDGITDGGMFAALVVLMLFNAAFGNVNTSSIHSFYRDRLSRAFVFSVRDDGDVQPEDGLKLSQLAGEGTEAPYHLVNVTLNLQGSKDPSLRGRESDFFILSKRYCGSLRTGYQTTKTMEALDHNLSLASAVAISGAAASPNAGTLTSKPLRFMLTMINARLAYWIANPAILGTATLRQRVLLALGPRPYYLFREAMGWLDGQHAHVNISDGGHIENLGMYELLRRRCRLIVAVDGEADRDLAFPGLVKLMRYARIDLGIRINMDLQAFERDENGYASRHHAIGHIDYGDGERGVLLYLKASMTGDENPYVMDYASRHPTFPAETTTDQFFDEAQFEAYRALGYHVADGAFHDADTMSELAEWLQSSQAEGPESVEFED